jgi:hypothetical protein
MIRCVSHVDRLGESPGLRIGLCVWFVAIRRVLELSSVLGAEQARDVGRVPVGGAARGGHSIGVELLTNIDQTATGGATGYDSCQHIVRALAWPAKPHAASAQLG